jgi:hypothetical protein
VARAVYETHLEPSAFEGFSVARLPDEIFAWSNLRCGVKDVLRARVFGKDSLRPMFPSLCLSRLHALTSRKILMGPQRQPRVDGEGLEK